MIINFKNVYPLKTLIRIFLIFVLLVFFPINTNSAELIQINDPNTILVGDLNRSLVLSLYCLDINENDMDQATKILKRNFPRGTKVKIKPYGSSDEKLLAKIFRIDDNTEMSALLNSLNSSDENCFN